MAIHFQAMMVINTESINKPIRIETMGTSPSCRSLFPKILFSMVESVEYGWAGSDARMELYTWVGASACAAVFGGYVAVVSSGCMVL